MRFLCSAAILALFSLLSVGSHAAESRDMDMVRSRYLEWVLGNGVESYNNTFSEKRLQGVIDGAKRVVALMKNIPLDEAAPSLYNTLHKGPEETELRYLITEALPALSVAYQLEGSANLPNYADALKEHRGRIDAWMIQTKDPRVDPAYDGWDRFPYYGEASKPRE